MLLQKQFLPIVIVNDKVSTDKSIFLLGQSFFSAYADILRGKSRKIAKRNASVSALSDSAFKLWIAYKETSSAMLSKGLLKSRERLSQQNLKNTFSALEKI